MDAMSLIGLLIATVSIVGLLVNFILSMVRDRRQTTMRRLDKDLRTVNSEYLEIVARGQAASGRIQASLQIAFNRISGQLAYCWNDENYTGLFELAESNGVRTGLNMTVHMRLLRYQSPHMYLDFKRNNSVLKRNLPEKLKNARIEYLESYISDKFNVYAPPGYRIDGLVIAAPDVLDAIDRNNLGADIEILGNQLYMIFPGIVRLDERLEEILGSAEIIAEAIDDNLSRYIDDRARGKKHSVANAGKRLIRR